MVSCLCEVSRIVRKSEIEFCAEMFTILQKNVYLFKLLGLDPFCQNNWKNQLNAISRMLLQFCFFSMALGNLISDIHGNDVRKAIESGPTFIGFLITFAYSSHLVINRDRFILLQTEMNEIVEERIRLKGNNRFYAEVEHRFTVYITIAIKTTCLMCFSAIFPLVRVAYHWCLGKYTINSWFFFFKLWLPIELNTTGRCFVMSLIEMCALFNNSFLLCAVLSFLTGIMMYTKAFLDDIKSLFIRIDGLSNSKPKRAVLAALEYCKEAIGMHARVMSCMQKMADVMNMIVLITITPSIVGTCSALFSFDIGNGTMQLSTLAVLFMLQALFAFCYLGQILHSNLIDLPDAIYQSNWYRHTRCFQRFILLMLMLSQQPFYISAFGIMRCNLENFVGVMKSVYSVLMLLRNIEEI